MQIFSESRIRHPRDAVFRVYRDNLEDIANYIDDIRHIKVLSREDGDGVVKLHNEWASDRDVPRMAQSMIQPEHLLWDDYAQWHESSFHCDWRIETRVFNEAITCSGQNLILKDGDFTIVRLTGDFTVALTEIPGVPKFMAKRLLPQVEKFIVALITPNLEKTNEAVGLYLDAQG